MDDWLKPYLFLSRREAQQASRIVPEDLGLFCRRERGLSPYPFNGAIEYAIESGVVGSKHHLLRSHRIDQETQR